MSATFSAAMPCYIGVTGTNGKTSCSWWLAQLLRALGQKAALVGTLGCGVWEQHQPVVLQETGYTTPDAKMLETILADFVRQGVAYVVMEVSSHGLEQGRTRAVTFSSALFTNLSRDHLDYHGSMERYGAAKEKLFLQSGLRHAVINMDDAFGFSLAQRLRAQHTNLQVLTYSLEADAADVYVKNLHANTEAFSGCLHTPWGVAEFQAPVTGDFNLANLLGVTAVLCAEGFALSSVLAYWPQLQGPPGRMEKVTVAGSDIVVLVDFAHTPDALEKVLDTIRKQLNGKLWCVFGCGGDRDSGKRPLMGAVVNRLADHGVVTSDNPRSESPQKIIEQILAAMDRRAVVKADRQQAIEYAIGAAAAGDVVLIAGKGHEKYQEIGGRKLPFDDVQQAEQALQRRAREMPARHQT